MERDVWIAAVTTGHNGSCCLLKNGEIVFFLEEERLSRIKYESMPLFGIQKIKEYTDRLDYFVMDESAERNHDNVHIRLCQKLGLIPQFGFHGLVDPKSIMHHEAHAAAAFYNSGFDEAVCVIVDGAGTCKKWLPTDPSVDAKIQQTVTGANYGAEVESVYVMSYPSKTDLLYKRIYNPLCVVPYEIGNLHFQPYIGPGFLYSALSTQLGHGALECGKAMGLSSYGKPRDDLKLMTTQGIIDRNMYLPDTIEMHKATLMNFNDYPPEDYCYAVQKVTEQYVLDLILKAIERSGCNKVVLGGGYMLNCVANYEYLKHLPKGTQIYIDPPSGDAGLAIGLAKKIWHTNYPSQPKKQETFYLGPLPDYNFNLPPNEFGSKIVSYKDIAHLLSDGNIVAMYQGRSEAGPRALGNRSILFDPRVIDGKDIVNGVKHREWYRPFAGTILKEHVHDWFDMRGLEESPFMMYAVNAKESAMNIIPAIIHVDGTCRIQTVTKQQNLHYYNLINAFYKRTGVPILFNTSFNLAGDPLVETMEDALNTLRNSEIKYLYLPEREELIWKY